MKKYKSWTLNRVIFSLPLYLFGFILVFTSAYLIIEDDKKLDVFIALTCINVAFPIFISLIIFIIDFIISLFRKYKYKIIDNRLMFNNKEIDINTISIMEIDYGVAISKLSIEDYKITIKYKQHSKKKTEILKDAPYRMIMYIIKQNKNIIVKKRNILKDNVFKWSASIVLGIIIGLIIKNSR